MRPETIDLNRTLILSALADIQAWERWASSVPEGAARNCHLSLIRLTKGLVKAWRLFLVERQDLSSNQSARSPMRPPAAVQQIRR